MKAVTRYKSERGNYYDTAEEAYLDDFDLEMFRLGITTSSITIINKWEEVKIAVDRYTALINRYRLAQTV